MSSDQLPDQDRTPASVLKAMAENEAAYPKDSCTECGVTLRLGFFFDGFGRNKDLDKENPTFLSNVSRLWMAHYNAGNKPVTNKQRWYGFYYSGLGVDLNEGAKEQILVSALTLAGGKMVDKAVSSAQDAAKNITRLDEVPDVDATGRAKKAVQQSIKDGSFHPMVKAYKDVVKDVQTLPEKTVRIWNAPMKGFEPSLFDKLFEAEGQSPYALRRLSIEEMKETVARDIEALLNTRMVFTEEDLRRFPNCQRSVLTYGLSDFSGLSLASHYDREFICRSLEQAIARHEPRLTHVRVMLQVDSRATSVLYFAITAMLDVGPAHEPVTFDATLQPSTLQYSVTKGWAKSPATV